MMMLAWLNRLMLLILFSKYYLSIWFACMNQMVRFHLIQDLETVKESYIKAAFGLFMDWEIPLSKNCAMFVLHFSRYRRTTTAISVVAPIRYAHSAASQSLQFLKFDNMSSKASSSNGDTTSSRKTLLPVVPVPHQKVGFMFFR